MGRRKKGERPEPRVINHCGTTRGRLRIGGKTYWLGVARDGRLSASQIRRADELIHKHEYMEKGFAVYVIGDGHGNWKIGKASAPESRLLELQIGNACPLFVAHAVFASEKVCVEVEYDAHQTLANRRIRGEWFRCQLFEAVDAVNEAMAGASARLKHGEVRKLLAAKLGIGEEEFS